MRYKSIPLPAAVLALSVAVCLGAAGPAESATSRASGQAEQRDAIEHLLEAIQLAAKKLTDQLTGQVAAFDRPGDVPMDASSKACPFPRVQFTPCVAILREALLNLPPPSC